MKTTHLSNDTYQITLSSEELDELSSYITSVHGEFCIDDRCDCSRHLKELEPDEGVGPS
jgi:hypothetical protein